MPKAVAKYPPNASKIGKSTNTAFEGFRVQDVSEIQVFILAILFFIAAFVIYFQLQVTLITLIKASQLLLIFGLAGFGVLFLIRKKFGLTVIDGLYCSTFAVAPFTMAFFLVANSFGGDEYTETYAITAFEPGSNGYIYNLENDAYADYWRIRNLSEFPSDLRNPSITYTFCDGVFGYKVMKQAEI